MTGYSLQFNPGWLKFCYAIGSGSCLESGLHLCLILNNPVCVEQWASDSAPAQNLTFITTSTNPSSTTSSSNDHLLPDNLTLAVNIPYPSVQDLWMDSLPLLSSHVLEIRLALLLDLVQATSVQHMTQVVLARLATFPPRTLAPQTPSWSRVRHNWPPCGMQHHSNHFQEMTSTSDALQMSQAPRKLARRENTELSASHVLVFVHGILGEAVNLA